MIFYFSLFLKFTRGMVDEAGDQFVGYFLPNEETSRKRKRDFADEINYVEDEE